MEEALKQIRIAQTLLDLLTTDDKDVLATKVALKLTVAKARHALQEAIAMQTLREAS